LPTFQQLIFDDFDNSIVDIHTRPGNGIITEPAGTLLELDAPNSASCEWYSTTVDAPLAYVNHGGGTFYRYETRLTAFAHTTNSCLSGICVFTDTLFANASYYMVWYPAENRIIVDLNAASRLWNGPSNDPATTPHRYRIYVNQTGHGVVVMGATNAVAIANNSISFWYSVDDGATPYVHIGTRALDFTPSAAGVFLRKWAAGAGDNAQSSFDYFETSVALPEPEYETVAGVQDEFAQAPPGTGGENYFVGPKRHGTGLAGDILVPGPPGQTVGSIGPFDVSASEDGAERLDQGGLPTHGEGLGVGHLFGIGHPAKQLSPVGGAEDSRADEIARLGGETTYSTITVDAAFNAHFTQDAVLGAFFYDTAGEDWANPGTSLLTGFARDGTRYTGGAQDGGPVNAPWATEAFSVTRGTRDDFPEQVLIAWTANSLVIFDLTNFPASLTMWMRFTVNTSALLRQSITNVTMINGTLAVSHNYSASGLFLVNFKGDSIATVAHLIRNDDHWRWNGTIADRNGTSLWVTSGVSPSLRVDSENNYDVSAYKDVPGTDKVWYAICGEDSFRVIEVVDGIPQLAYQPAELNHPANIGDIRNVHFDERGWLWTSEQSRLWRHVFSYQGGSLISEYQKRPAQTGVNEYHQMVNLPDEITGLAAARNHIYCATAKGIYRVERGSMVWELYFSIAGGGGTKEVVFGDSAPIDWLRTFSFQNSSYVSVATKQGVTLIRLFDDFAIEAISHPDLDEPGAFFNIQSWS